MMPMPTAFDSYVERTVQVSESRLGAVWRSTHRLLKGMNYPTFRKQCLSQIELLTVSSLP
jgi:hypothetical protein